jgi:Protein of unknown function (DUF2934)
MSRHHLHTQTAVATPESKTVRHPAAIKIPTHDEIAHRAYDIYVKIGYKQGQCNQNWQQAEKSLLG